MSLVLNRQRSRPETIRLIFSENYAPPNRIAMKITNVGVDGWGKGYLNGDDNDDTSISNKGILHCLSIFEI